MEKQQLLSLIEDGLATGKITKDDLAHFGASTSAGATSHPVLAKEESSKNLINTFYGIGALIALIGIVILVAEHWDEIGFAGRILVTLGISVATYVAGLLFRKPEQKMMSQVFFTIAALLAPIGSYVLLNQANIDFDLTTQLTTACVLLVVFGGALYASRKNILVLITMGYASWAYYAFILKIFDYDYADTSFLKWATMILGISYLCITYGYQMIATPTDHSDAKEKHAIQNIMYGIGTLAILGTGITIGGSFDLFFILFIFAAFYGSVYVRSRTMLSLGAFFLIAHIIKLTSKYFIDSVGWPVSLIVVGFLVIGIGYGTFYLNKKYIVEK